MKSFVVNFKRAVFGWPFYAVRNLAAYTSERHGRARAVRLLAATVFWTLTTGVLLVWLTAGR